jgi:hypothetical protein
MLTKEQLTNKYIKYNSLITEEIFDKIISKLVEYFGESNRGMPTKYNDFKNDYGYIQIFSNNNNYNWSLDNNAQNNEEIQVSDILGSDYDIDKFQFEIGKWYKILNNWWGKFETIHNSGKRIKFSEVITYSGKYKNEGTHIDYISDIKLLTDLLEIQQYLPDGHPDKLPKLLTIDDLVEGEVYFYTFTGFCDHIGEYKGDYSNKYDIAFNHVNENDPSFNKDTKSKSSFTDGTLKEGSLRIATTEEKHWLNVCIAEDKLVEKEVALKDYDTCGEVLKSKVNKPVDEPFEFNKWYKFNNEDGLFFIKSKNTGYGFRSNHVNCWFVRTPDMGNWDLNNLILAEDSEVKERLLNCAKEKYPVGTRINSNCGSFVDKKATISEDLYWNGSGISHSDIPWVYFDGKWAEIISTPEVKQFDRNWYVKVNSQEEADKVFDWLEAQGEKIKPGKYTNSINNYLRMDLYEDIWRLSSNTASKPQKQLSDILPEYKQSIKTKEELSHIIDTNKELRNEIRGLINQRDFKSSDFAEPIIIKSKKQKRNKLIIVNN